MVWKFETEGKHKKYEVDQSEEIIIFSKDNCSYCMYVIRLFDELQFKYTVLKLGSDFTKADHYKKFGVDAKFPQVEVDDTNIGGCRDTVIWLKNEGYLPGSS